MNYVIIYAQKRAQSYAWIFTNMTAQYFWIKHSVQNVSFWQHSVQNWQEMYCMKICVEQKSKTCLGSWKIVHNNTAYQVFYHMTR